MYEQRQGRREKCEGKKIQWHLFFFFLFTLTVAAPDLLDPKNATHNTKPRLSFSTKPITLTPREESEVRDVRKKVQTFKSWLWFSTQGCKKLPVCVRVDWSVEVLQVAATVMKWKTVTAIFLLVVLYLVMGAAVFKALEQPHER